MFSDDRAKSALTRRERGMVRILHSRGLHNKNIANVVGCSLPTVSNILSGFTLAASNDDPTQDYDHVDDAFKAKYPPSSRFKRVSPGILNELITDNLFV
jgi:hypothetical protein